MDISWSLVAFFVLVFLAATTGGIFKPGDWYKALDKPSWNPPDWAFPIAWTALYAMMAVAAWQVFKAVGFSAAGVLALSFWLVQLIFNALWSALFFGVKRMDWALWDALLMWAAIVGTIVTFAPISMMAALLMVPYLLWVSFAVFLNWTIMKLNPEETGPAGETGTA